MHIIIPIPTHIFPHCEINYEEVKPETVTSFINDYDRNNNKIFEGDIVDILRNDGTKTGRGVVTERDCIIENGNGYRRLIGCSNSLIVGNIFDNPDLVDEKTKKWLDNYWIRKGE